MQIKAAIFDVDGILVDSEALQMQGWVEVLKPFGKSLSKEQYLEYAGKSTDIIATLMKKDFKLDADVDLMVDEKHRIILELFKDKLELMSHAREAIEFFINNNIKVASAGGAMRVENIFKLKKVGLVDLFPIIVSVDDVEKGKPNPDMYLLAAKKLDVKPEHCVVFEDTMYGLRAAKDAGCICIAVPNEFTKTQDFSRADKIVNNLEEAIEYIKKSIAYNSSGLRESIIAFLPL